MIEAKAKEFALLHYREAALRGEACVRPALPGDDEAGRDEDANGGGGREGGDD